MDRLTVSAVVPAYNEAPGLAETLSRLDRTLRMVCGPDGYEILLVDDGSTDGSFERLYVPPRALVLRHQKNRGYGAALKTGIRQAKHATILICDADGTYPIEELPRLAGAVSPEALVVAERETIWYPRGRLLKKTLRGALRLWLALLTGRSIPDINSGFRLFPRESVLPELDDLSDRFSFTTGLTLIWLFTGRPVVYVRTPYAARKGESKVAFIRDGLRLLRQTLRLTWSRRPSRLVLIFLLPAAAATAAGVLLLRMVP